MEQLRAFELDDAETVISWIKDEHSFLQWSADTYKKYPIYPVDMIARYDEVLRAHNGMAFPLIFMDEGVVVGHLLVRVIDKEQGLVRFGYIIVDSEKRGKGYGSKMLRIALEYACEKLGAKRVTLGVFENNPSAYRCYKAVGFNQIDSIDTIINGEPWKCLELEYVFESK